MRSKGLTILEGYS